MNRGTSYLIRQFYMCLLLGAGILNKPTEKNEYIVTIEGDAVENTDYTVSGVNDLTKVEEGTTLTIEAVSKINVDGTNLEIGETTIIEVTESKTITINKQIDQVSAINITTNPIDTSGLAHDAGDVTVALATSTSESAIHYTIDGSNPTVE